MLEILTRPEATVEQSTEDIVKNIRRYEYLDFDNPKYYNIRWMQLLEQAQSIISVTGSVFEAKSREEAD